MSANASLSIFNGLSAICSILGFLFALGQARKAMEEANKVILLRNNINNFNSALFFHGAALDSSEASKALQRLTQVGHASRGIDPESDLNTIKEYLDKLSTSPECMDSEAGELVVKCRTSFQSVSLGNVTDFKNDMLELFLVLKRQVSNFSP